MKSVRARHRLTNCIVNPEPVRISPRPVGLTIDAEDQETALASRRGETLVPIVVVEVAENGAVLGGAVVQDQFIAISQLDD